MKNLKVWLLTAVFALALIPTANAESVATAKVLAVKFYADWCSSCRLLAEPYNILTQEFENDAILFLTLDFTDAGTTHQTEMLAQAIGIGEILDKNRGTGFILLIDSTGQVERLTGSQTYEEMAAHIKARLDHVQKS